MSGIEEYEVEYIMAKDTIDGKSCYKIKWHGFPESEATWEKRSNLIKFTGLKHMIEKFNDNLKFKKSVSPLSD